MRGPSKVKIVADAQNFDVLKAEWEWTDIAMPMPNSPGVEPRGVGAEDKGLITQGKRPLAGKPIGKTVMAGMPVTKRISLNLTDNPIGNSKRNSSSKGQSATGYIDPLWFEPSFHVQSVLNGQLPPNGTSDLPASR